MSKIAKKTTPVKTLHDLALIAHFLMIKKYDIINFEFLSQNSHLPLEFVFLFDSICFI